jgi:type IV secretory pathway VirB2 component (pilin)
MPEKSLRRRVLSIGLFYLIAAAATTYAADITDSLGLGSKLDDIVNVFKSKLIRVILIVAVGGCAIGLIVNKDNEAMKKRFMIIGVAAIILLGVQGLVDFVWTPKG